MQACVKKKIGPSNSGKSSEQRKLQAVYGGYFGTFSAGDVAVDARGGGSSSTKRQFNWVLAVADKRILMAQEGLREGSLLDAAAVKSLASSGDIQMTGPPRNRVSMCRLSW